MNKDKADEFFKQQKIRMDEYVKQMELNPPFDPPLGLRQD